MRIPCLPNKDDLLFHFFCKLILFNNLQAYGLLSPAHALRQRLHRAHPSRCISQGGEACEQKKQTCSIDLRKLVRYALRIIGVTLATLA